MSNFKAGDKVVVLDNAYDTHKFFIGQEVDVVDPDTTNAGSPACVCVDKYRELWWVKKENLRLVEERITLRPGDFVLTSEYSEIEHMGVAEAFMNAGALRGEYGAYPRSICEAFGWREYTNSLYHGSPCEFKFGGKQRQLTVNQVLDATEARKRRDQAQEEYEEILRTIQDTLWKRLRGR